VSLFLNNLKTNNLTNKVLRILFRRKFL